MGDQEAPFSEESESAQWPAAHAPFSGAPGVPSMRRARAASVLLRTRPPWGPRLGPTTASAQPAGNQPAATSLPTSRQRTASRPRSAASRPSLWAKALTCRQPYGQQPSRQHPTRSRHTPSRPYGHSLMASPPYGQQPMASPYGQPPYGPEQPYQRGHERCPARPFAPCQGLRSAAAILVVAAAGVAGAGVSRVACRRANLTSGALHRLPRRAVAEPGGDGGLGTSPLGGAGGRRRGPAGLLMFGYRFQGRPRWWTSLDL